MGWTRRARLWAGLAVLGAMVLVGREARAGLATSGITITGGIVQDSGDPPYTYQFAIYLHGTLLPVPAARTSVTFTHLLGVGSASQFLSPPLAITTADQFGDPWTPGIHQTQGPTLGNPTQDYFSDVTWTYAGHHAIPSGPNSLFLGVFEVTTVEDLAAGYPPALISSPISYSYTLNGGNPNAVSNSGTLILQEGGVFDVVPEPSTAIAVLWAVASLPLAWYVRRRGRRRRQAA